MATKAVYTKPGQRLAVKAGIASPGVHKHRMGNKRATIFERRSATEAAITGVTLEPFDGLSQVSGELAQIAKAPGTESYCRKLYTDECEAAVNRQINIEYSVSYLYHSMFSFFDRDNVGLPGFAEYFKHESEEERSHAEKLMEYQTLRGGRVVLGSLMSPISEFDNSEKGEALYSMELALSLEKMNYEKLLDLHEVASKNDDPHLCDFVESEYLQDQLESIRTLGNYVSQLRRVGTGHGVYHFDIELKNSLN